MTRNLMNGRIGYRANRYPVVLVCVPTYIVDNRGEGGLETFVDTVCIN